MRDVALSLVFVSLGLPVGAQSVAESTQPRALSQSDSYLQQLVEALRTDDSYKVRLQAAVLLGRSSAPNAVEPLIETLARDEHYTVRAAAAMALANLDARAAIPHIVRQAATDPDAFVQQESMRALNKYGVAEALSYVVAAYGSEDPRIRQQVVEYLAQHDPKSAQTILTRALGDTKAIAEIAQESIAAMPAAERLQFLQAASEHRNPEVRRGAVEALRAEETADATQLILEIYERDIEVDTVRDATREALRQLRRLLPIKKILRDARGANDKHRRARALRLLGVVGGPDAQQALVHALNDDEVYLRGTAVMALRELGAPETIPDLERLLRDPKNQRIALQIRTAVQHLKRQQPAPN